MRYIARFLLFHASLPLSLSLFLQPVAMHLTPCGRNSCLKTVKKQEKQREKEQEEPKAREAFSNSRSAAVCCVSFTLSFLTLPRLAVHCLAREERDSTLCAKEKAANYKQIIAGR